MYVVSCPGFNHLTVLKLVATLAKANSAEAVQFQSPYGVKVGCNFLSKKRKKDLQGFNHLTVLKLVTTANGRGNFVLNAIPGLFPLCEIKQAHRHHRSIKILTIPSQKQSENASLQPVIIIQQTSSLVKFFHYSLQIIKT